MRNTYNILEKTMRKEIRKPLLLYKMLTNYIEGKNKVQQINKREINKLQYILFMKQSLVRHEISIITTYLF